MRYENILVTTEFSPTAGAAAEARIEFAPRDGFPLRGHPAEPLRRRSRILGFTRVVRAAASAALVFVARRPAPWWLTAVVDCMPAAPRRIRGPGWRGPAQGRPRAVWHESCVGDGEEDFEVRIRIDDAESPIHTTFEELLLAIQSVTRDDREFEALLLTMLTENRLHVGWESRIAA